MCTEYKNAVDTLFRLQASDIIQNGKPEHAAILLGSIFKYAKDHVYLFCENLKKEVFDNDFLSSEISDACTRNISIRILLNGTNIDSEKVKTFKEKYSCVTIKHFTGNLDQEIHFAVSDGCAYRIERDHENVRAFGCANRPQIAQALEALFEEMMPLTATI